MFSQLECKCQIVKNFTPSWFASVMGTGILALVSLFYAKYLSLLGTISKWLFYFNVVLFFLLLIPWVLRWIFFPKNAISDLEHPVISNFYPTLSVGMLVLSANYMVIGKNYQAGEIFWFIGAILTIFFAILTPFIAFKGEHVKLDHINPGWFIPPVGLIVIPIPGSLLINHVSPYLKETVLLLNIFGWGAGFFLYITLLAICMYRFILHHPLPGVLAPTVWINLGPIGAGTTALINLTKQSGLIQTKAPIFFFGLLFWSFGLWWLAMAIIMTLYYIHKIKIPYTMSWWAFTFPLGAYVSASYIIGNTFHLKLAEVIGFGIYWLLVILWGITLIKTAREAYKGSVFK